MIKRILIKWVSYMRMVVLGALSMAVLGSVEEPVYTRHYKQYKKAKQLEWEKEFYLSCAIVKRKRKQLKRIKHFNKSVVNCYKVI